MNNSQNNTGLNHLVYEEEVEEVIIGHIVFHKKHPALGRGVVINVGEMLSAKIYKVEFSEGIYGDLLREQIELSKPQFLSKEKPNAE